MNMYESRPFFCIMSAVGARIRAGSHPNTPLGRRCERRLQGGLAQERVQGQGDALWRGKEGARIVDALELLFEDDEGEDLDTEQGRIGDERGEEGRVGALCRLVCGRRHDCGGG